LEKELNIPAGTGDIPHIAEIQRVKTAFMTKDSSTESKGFARRLLQDINKRLCGLLVSDVKEIDILELDIAAIDLDSNLDSNPWVKNLEGNLVRFSDLECRDKSIQDMSSEKINRYPRFNI
jgi:hypothetical protein